MVFRTEGDVRDGARTPIFGDGVEGSWVRHGWSPTGPRATDHPTRDLCFGRVDDGPGMALFTISRHGSRPATPPTNHPAGQRLPGAINMAFQDGHAETTQLERLWGLYWHREYVAPRMRPGL
jgi:prepilin-type processing-associated H-X9-DG protein